MKKKLVVLLSLVLTMSFMVCGCGTNETKTSTNKDSQSENNSNNEKNEPVDLVEEFHNNTTEIKIGETHTASDGTVVTLTNAKVVGEDAPEMCLFFSVSNNGSLNVKSRAVVKSEDELKEVSPESSQGPVHMVQDQDGTYRVFLRIGAEDFTQQTLDESPLCYLVFNLNGTEVYFDLKKVTIPSDI